MPIVKMKSKRQITIPASDDVLSYAGLFAGAWGKTSAEFETNIRNLHNEWESWER